MKFEDYRRHDALGLAELVARREVSAGELLDTATARMVLAPILSGMFVARKVRFATWAAVPFTVTCACWLFTVPTTVSFTFPATEIEEAVVTNWSVGDVMVTCGGVVSSVNVMLAVPVEPLAEVAVAVTIFGPSASGTDAVNVQFATGAAMELITTVAAGSPTRRYLIADDPRFRTRIMRCRPGWR